MSSPKIITDISGYAAHAMPVDIAQAVVLRSVSSVKLEEKVTLRSALGRVLAQDVLAVMDVPAHDNSAMDGYALMGADLQQAAATRLQVVGTSLAGHESAVPIQPGQAMRIMTGAVMPAGCDTVVPQEFCQVQADMIEIPPNTVRAGENRRLRGEDLTQGQAALRQGQLIRPADLGLMASLGLAEVSVYRKLRVAFFSTGDELRSVGEPLDAGCVYDSNRYTLWGMLTRLGCEVLDLGVVRDSPTALQAAFEQACAAADVVITSGGVSVGEADFVKQTMQQMGNCVFWKVAMRPGRPMAFGYLQADQQGAWLFGLPGNPVAVMVTFYFFVRPALQKMMGLRAGTIAQHDANANAVSAAADLTNAAPVEIPMLRAQSASFIRKKAGRTEYQRGIVSRTAQGKWQVQVTGSQGSGVLRSMSEANAFIVLHHAQTDVAAGDEVDVLLFDGLV